MSQMIALLKNSSNRYCFSLQRTIHVVEKLALSNVRVRARFQELKGLDVCHQRLAEILDSKEPDLLVVGIHGDGACSVRSAKGRLCDFPLAQPSHRPRSL
jgi:hypothetical protein